MPISVAIWAQALAPGKRVRVMPEADVQISTITLGESIVDEKGRSTIKLYRAKMPLREEDEEDEDEPDLEKIEFEKEPIVLGHLLAGRVESQLMNLIITEDEPIEFEVTGKNVVQLYGNFIDQGPLGGSTYGDGMSDEGEGEDDYDLDDVSSDVEMNAGDFMLNGLEDDSDDETHGRIEEVKADVVAPVSSKKDKKRQRESDAAADPVDAAQAPAAEEGEKRKSKKQRKAEKAAAKANGVEAKPKELTKPAVAETAATPEASKEKKGERETLTTKNGTKVEIFTKGTGANVKAGQRVQMRYIGKLSDGTVFDKNTNGKPFYFVAGKGEVIKGWDEGIVGLPIGSEALLTIPPAAGYGNKKSGPIPPNSTLKFEIKVLGAS